MVHVLHVVVIIKRVEKQSHFLDMLLVCERGVGRGNLCCLGRKNGIAHACERVCNVCNCRRVGCYLNAAVLECEIVAARFKNVLHSFVFVNSFVLVIENNNALGAEHKRNAARSSEVTAEFVEIVADLARSSVAVIGKAFYDYSNAVRTVALINAGFVVVLFAVAACLFNKAVDIIVGDIVGFSFLDKLCELGVGVRVAAALFYSYNDLAAYFCENFRSCTVFFALFAFNGAPF